MAAHIEASQILDNSPVGMTVFDIATREITYANQSGANLLGMPREAVNLANLHSIAEVVDQNGDTVSPDEYATRLAADAKSQESRVIGLRFFDGRLLWLNVRAVYGELNGREVVVTSFTDITDIIEAQQHEYEFIQNVSHELRTPLAIIYGYIDLILTGTLGEMQPEIQDALERAKRKAETLRLLVERSLGILTAEQKISDRFEPVSMAQLLEDTMLDFTVLLRDVSKRLDVEVDTRFPDDTEIMGNRRLLWLVLANILTNAVKFTPDGGAVWVRGYVADGNCVIEVEDSGIGIPADKIHKIFDRFYQVDGSSTRRYGGTGIGLHFALTMIRQHGGDIAVESEYGRGSVFKVYLPLWMSR